MIDLKKYEKLRTDVERLQRDRDRAEGALSQLMGQLKSEFDCNDLGEAESLLVKLKREQSKVEASFNQALEKFEERWENKLKRSDG